MVTRQHIGRHDRSASEVHPPHRQRLPRPRRRTVAASEPNQTHRTTSSRIPERCTSGAVWPLLAKRNAKRNRSTQRSMHRLQRSQRRTPRRLPLGRRDGAGCCAVCVGGLGLRSRPPKRLALEDGSSGAVAMGPPKAKTPESCRSGKHPWSASR